jgi:hypothetical protein
MLRQSYARMEKLMKRNGIVKICGVTSWHRYVHRSEVQVKFRFLVHCNGLVRNLIVLAK